MDFIARPFLAAFVLLCCGLLAAVSAQAAPVQATLAPVDPAGATFRLYEGVTFLVHNPDGKAFNVDVDVRDFNLVEPGPREVLCKVYDPTGKAVVREIIPDDGVTTPITQLPTGGWDHEGWFYAYQNNSGAPPMLKWSPFTAADRLAATPVRTFKHPIAGGAKGVYRVVLMGSKDHVVTVKIDGGLSWAVGGSPVFLHPVGDMLKKRYVYIPKNTNGLFIGLIEYDTPRTRKFTLKDDTGKVITEGTAGAGIGFGEAKPAKPGDWDDKVFTFELSDGPNACMAYFSLMSPKMEGMVRPVPAATPAFFAPDEKTARALQNGAIYHDGQVFWQQHQVRLYEWLKTVKPEEAEPMGADGKPVKRIEIKNGNVAASYGIELAPNRNAEYLPLNGPHERGPIADTVMFSYDLHHNKAALNLAIKSLASGLRTLGPNDTPVNATWKGTANLAYTFGTYSWHWWRPAWRILQEKDTPEPVREIVREAITNAADRLAFCRGGERINGNAFSTVVCGLRYAYAGTGDKLNEELFNTFYERFTTGGWGPRVGLGPSGPIQEEFAYDAHYGSYPIFTWGAVSSDLKDPRFIKVRDRLLNFYSYIQNDEVSACGYSSRTAHNPDIPVVKDGPLAWKGYPGPDLTESVNGANEFFAARRKSYYILTYHGRMTPKWQGAGFMGQMGWSGGMMLDFVVPGKGTVLASTMDAPGYGNHMHPSEWRTFRIHSLVGTTADGVPLISSDCEHPDAKLDGNTLTGSGEVRLSSVRATRSYTYNPDHVVAKVSLRMTDDDGFLGFWFKSPFRGYVTEAWEMLPFIAATRGKPGQTTATVIGADGKDLGDLKEAPIEGKTVVIDRGGFGVKIELAKPTMLKRGAGNTVMIQAVVPSGNGPRDPAKQKPNVDEVSLEYKIIPFGAE